MENIGFILLSISVLLALVRWFVFFTRYIDWREYDKEFGTEYRFNEGRSVERAGWFFRMRLLMEQTLRMIEQRWLPL